VVAETKDGRNTLCALVAAEPTLDLALLRLEVWPKGNPPSFGVGELSTSNVRPGQLAFAVGDPFGPERFFALGLISSIPSRGCYQDQLTATFLQTTMVLHPEAYGGPLVDIDGKILGVMIPRRRATTVAAGSAGAAANAPDPAPARPMGIEFALPSPILG